MCCCHTATAASWSCRHAYCAYPPTHLWFATSHSVLQHVIELFIPVHNASNTYSKSTLEALGNCKRAKEIDRREARETRTIHTKSRKGVSVVEPPAVRTEEKLC